MNGEFHWRIRAAVIGWLRYKQRCPVVCWERSPFSQHNYRPDIIGVNRERKAIEVEIKQTFSDFKNNAKKRGLQWRYEWPVRYYFAVPRKLVEKVKPLLPDGCGLITLAEMDGSYGPIAEVVVGAAHNRQARRINKYEVARMIMHQTGSLHRATVALAMNGCAPVLPEIVPMSSDQCQVSSDSPVRFIGH